MIDKAMSFNDLDVIYMSKLAYDSIMTVSALPVQILPANFANSRDPDQQRKRLGRVLQVWRVHKPCLRTSDTPMHFLYLI